jgi:hypothetical protein
MLADIVITRLMLQPISLSLRGATMLTLCVCLEEAAAALAVGAVALPAVAVAAVVLEVCFK